MTGSANGIGSVPMFPLGGCFAIRRGWGEAKVPAPAAGLLLAGGAAALPPPTTSGVATGSVGRLRLPIWPELTALEVTGFESTGFELTAGEVTGFELTGCAAADAAMTQAAMTLTAANAVVAPEQRERRAMLCRIRPQPG